MNCAEFQERLFEWLEDRLEAAEVERLKAHAAGCLRCKELEELATGDAGLPAIEPPDDMVASIMAETTGGACDRALLLVSERLAAAAAGAAAVDGKAATGLVGAAGAAASDPLLEMHLESCAECAKLAGALARLQRELPSMAEMEPDQGFLADVMAATVGVAAPAGAATPALHLVTRPEFEWRSWVRNLPLVARVSAVFESLTQRPRLAFEGAFVGTLAFILVLGAPASGVADLPSRLMAEVPQVRLEVQSAVASNLGRAADAGLSVWTASTERLSEIVNISPDRVSMRSRLADMYGSWRQAGVEIATHLWDGEFRAAFARMWRLWTEPWSGSGDEEGSAGSGIEGASPEHRGSIQEG